MENRIDLDALEAKLAKATPGPWRRGSRHEYVVVHLDHGYIVCDEDPEDDNAERVEADTDTIIAARNALPALIAELRELRAEVERLREDADRARSTVEWNAEGGAIKNGLYLWAGQTLNGFAALAQRGRRRLYLDWHPTLEAARSAAIAWVDEQEDATDLKGLGNHD